MNARIFDAASCMDQAEEEITEKLLEGKQVDRYDFAGILDSEMDRGTRVMAEEVAGHITGILDVGMDEHTHVERRKALELWARSLIESFLDSHPELIEERAAEIAATEEPKYDPLEENAA